MRTFVSHLRDFARMSWWLDNEAPNFIVCKHQIDPLQAPFQTIQVDVSHQFGKAIDDLLNEQRLSGSLEQLLLPFINPRWLRRLHTTRPLKDFQFVHTTLGRILQRSLPDQFELCQLMSSQDNFVWLASTLPFPVDWRIDVTLTYLRVFTCPSLRCVTCSTWVQ